MRQKYLPILLLAIFPFLLIKDLPLMWVRYFSSTIIVIYLFYQAFTKYSFKQLGYFKPSKWDYFYFVLTPFLILVPLLILRLPNYCPPEPLGFLETTPAWLLLLVYGLMSALGQEFMYRSFLINNLEEVLKDRKVVLIVGAALFSLLHIAWGPYFVIGSLLLGFYFVWWFMHTRNVVLISILHVPMTIFAIFICYI